MLFWRRVMLTSCYFDVVSFLCRVILTSCNFDVVLFWRRAILTSCHFDVLFWRRVRLTSYYFDVVLFWRRVFLTSCHCDVILFCITNCRIGKTLQSYRLLFFQNELSRNYIKGPHLFQWPEARGWDWDWRQALKPPGLVILF